MDPVYSTPWELLCLAEGQPGTEAVRPSRDSREVCVAEPKVRVAVDKGNAKVKWGGRPPPEKDVSGLSEHGGKYIRHFGLI